MRKLSAATRRIGTLVALILGALVVGVPTSAGASVDCGTHSFGFEGTRLLNDGISDTAGPFAIELPAGTYDVTMLSNDWAHSDPAQLTQPEEQWFFTLDSGYSSPVTADIPDDETDGSLVAAAQQIEASTSITVHHRGVGGINSINPMCVGFTPVGNVSPAAPDPVVQPVTGEPPGEDATEPEPEEPAVTEIPPPASIVRNPEPDPVTVEVEGRVETPTASPQLALTGLNNLAVTLSIFGVAMIGVGIGLIGRERRLHRSN